MFWENLVHVSGYVLRVARDRYPKVRHRRPKTHFTSPPEAEIAHGARVFRDML